jgi:hypothetical protein
MSTMPTNSTAATQRVAWGRFLWVAPLAIAAAVAANAIIRTISKAIFSVPDEFGPFMPSNFVSLTVFGGVGAMVVFALVGWLSKRPFRLFNWIAGVVLVLTWIPDVMLLVARPFPGITFAGVATLMVMHATAAGIIVWLLNTQAKAK